MATLELNEAQILSLIEAIDWADRECYSKQDPLKYPEAYQTHRRWMALRTSLEIMLGRNVGWFA